MDVSLGKLPPKRYYAEVAVKAADFLDLRRLPAPPANKRVSYGVGIDFGMFLNDNLSDCTCAAIAHAEQIHSARNKRPERPTDEDVLELYRTTGVEQGLGDDDGRYMEGVLKHLATVGMRQSGGDTDTPAGAYEKILGYAAVNPHDHDEVRACAWLFGGVYFGAALPLSAQVQRSQKRSWSCKEDGNTAPGSWGGHAMWLPAVHRNGIGSITWASRQGITWCWWDKYVDEVYAVVTEDWTQGTAPSGFDRQALIDWLREING